MFYPTLAFDSSSFKSSFTRSISSSLCTTPPALICRYHVSTSARVFQLVLSCNRAHFRCLIEQVGLLDSLGEQEIGFGRFDVCHDDLFYAVEAAVLPIYLSPNTCKCTHHGRA